MACLYCSIAPLCGRSCAKTHNVLAVAVVSVSHHIVSELMLVVALERDMQYSTYLFCIAITMT
jgi:hypothetical protein